jgi:integrase
MRRDEIARLAWDNVDLRKRAVYLSKTKNGEERTVPLSPAAIGILKEIPNGNSVFGMAADNITRSMKQACKAANIENLTFHDLRHEATSRLFENTDLDVMEIKSITGHRSMQMLARYSHLRTSRLADRLAGARRGVDAS